MLVLCWITTRGKREGNVQGRKIVLIDTSLGKKNIKAIGAE